MRSITAVTFLAAALAACNNTPSGGAIVIVQGTDKVASGDASFNAPSTSLPAAVFGSGAGAAGEAEIEAITLQHSVGETPCPQLLGSLVVTNNSDATAEVVLATRDLVAIAFKPTGSFAVGPGASAEVAIEFTCASTDDIDTLIDVSIGNDGESNNFSLPITLDISFPGEGPTLQPFNNAGTDMPAALSDAEGAPVEAVMATHHVGETACPQLLGTLAVRNDSDSPVSFAIQKDGELALEIDPASVDVPPGGSAELRILFTCASTDDIDTTLQVRIVNEAEASNNFDLPLTLDVVPPAARLGAQALDPEGAEVPALELAHTVGGTSCPQPLGKIVATNDGGSTATLAVALDDDVAVELLPGNEVQVPAGDSAEITVQFTCASTDDIDTTLRVTVDDGNEQAELAVPLKLDISE